MLRRLPFPLPTHVNFRFDHDQPQISIFCPVTKMFRFTFRYDARCKLPQQIAYRRIHLKNEVNWNRILIERIKASDVNR